MKINLHIERLVLDGLPMKVGQSALIQSAMETEITRLLLSTGLAPELMSGGAVPSLPAGSIQLANDATPTRLGHQIAGAVHRQIGGMAQQFASETTSCEQTNVG